MTLHNVMIAKERWKRRAFHFQSHCAFEYTPLLVIFNVAKSSFRKLVYSHDLTWWTAWVPSPVVVFQINPAPKNPTPEGMAADTLEASQFMGPSKKANTEEMVKRHAPMHTRDIVLMPAGRSTARLSQPMTAPRMEAVTILLAIIASSRLMPSSLTRTHDHIQRRDDKSVESQRVKRVFITHHSCLSK